MTLGFIFVYIKQSDKLSGFWRNSNPNSVTAAIIQITLSLAFDESDHVLN